MRGLAWESGERGFGNRQFELMTKVLETCTEIKSQQFGQRETQTSLPLGERAAKHLAAGRRTGQDGSE